MPYKLQLKDARNSIQLKSIAGLCTNTDDFVAILNEAMRRLNRRGSWFDTEWVVRLCIYNGCITWPRYVGTVLGIRFCFCAPFEIRNNWWDILGPRGCTFGNGEFSIGHTMRDAGTAPAYNEITGSTGKEIRIYATKNEDLNKEVVLYGIDSNGQPLQEKKNGAWQQGLTVVLKNPYGTTSPVLVKRITSVTKDVTESNVLMYEYDAASTTLRDLAVYEPSETHPRYRRSVIDNFNCIPTNCSESNGVTMRTAEVLAHLEFIEVQHDNDFLPIDNLDAVKLMIQAIRDEEANQEQMAETKITKAIRELNFEQRSRNPGQQVTVRVNPTGAYLTNPI